MSDALTDEKLVEMKIAANDAHRRYEALGMTNAMGISQAERAALGVRYDRAWKEFQNAKRAYETALSALPATTGE